ncbi:MAG: hypothetical protein JXB88_24485 [Spirochaetales bacterium]|nr:hypothetical protein [Spirochaetales bacterium]
MRKAAILLYRPNSTGKHWAIRTKSVRFHAGVSVVPITLSGIVQYEIVLTIIIIIMIMNA